MESINRTISRLNSVEFYRDHIFKLLCFNYENLSDEIKSKITEPDFNQLTYNILETLFSDNFYVEIEDENGYRPIHSAIKYGRLDIVKLLLSKNCSMKPHRSSLLTPLHIACIHNCNDIVELLSVKCDLDAGNEDNIRPIHIACGNGNLDLVKFLISKHCDIRVKDIYGYQIIHSACVSDNVELFEYLLSKKFDLEEKTSEGATLLHLACCHGSINLVAYLLSKNCDIEAVECNNIRPIHEACQNNKTEVVKLLISRNCNIDAETNNKQTPLHCACAVANSDIVKLLLHNNCEINIKDIDGQRPIDIAIENDDREVVELLLPKFDKNDIEYAEFGKESLIHRICRLSRLNVVELLLSKNYNFEIVDSTGQTPMQIACRYGAINVVRLLLKENIDFEAQDSNGKRPIHISCEYNKYEIVELLISNNCDINANDSNGNTPMDLATRRGHTEIIELLLSKLCQSYMENQKSSRLSIIIQNFILDYYFKNEGLVEKYISNIIPLNKSKNRPMFKLYHFVKKIQLKWITPSIKSFNIIEKDDKLLNKQNYCLIYQKEIIKKYVNICSVCFINQIDSRSDCGHLFCRHCLGELEHCSSCRQRITNFQFIEQL